MKVRPWNAPVKATTALRPVAKRAILMAFSTASAPVVGGVALLLAYGRTGLVGRWLYEATGWQVPFTAAAVVLAQTFVALPFLVVTVEGALRSTGTALEEAAATLGAGPLTTFRRITLPLLTPVIFFNLIMQMVQAFRDETGHEIPVVVGPRRPGDLAEAFAGVDKAARELGWRAERDLAAMVADSWRWQSTNPAGYSRS